MTAPAPEKCDVCGASPIEIVLFPVAVHYKGSGFYSTDYGKKGKAAASKDGGEWLRETRARPPATPARRRATRRPEDRLAVEERLVVLVLDEDREEEELERLALAGLRPGKAVPVRRPLPARRLEPPHVRLFRVGRLLVHARAVARRELRHRVAHMPVPGPGAGHQDRARLVAGADEDVLRSRRAMDEVPRPQPPLLTLDEQQALAGENEEVLLLSIRSGRGRSARRAAERGA